MKKVKSKIPALPSAPEARKDAFGLDSIQHNEVRNMNISAHAVTEHILDATAWQQAKPADDLKIALSSVAFLLHFCSQENGSLNDEIAGGLAAVVSLCVKDVDLVSIEARNEMMEAFDVQRKAVSL